jgi:REP element-mobilizing transposase RayT
MKEYQSLSHTRWDCKYHVVFIPKRRKKQIFGALRRQLGEIFRELAQHKESVVVEGHLMPDHVHMCLSIPPKYAVSNVVGYIKGKSAITIAAVRRARTQLYGRSVLGQRLLRIDGRTGRRDGPRIHPESREGRRAVRPNAVEIVASRQGRLTGSWRL